MCLNLEVRGGWWERYDKLKRKASFQVTELEAMSNSLKNVWSQWEKHTFSPVELDRTSCRVYPGAYHKEIMLKEFLAMNSFKL